MIKCCQIMEGHLKVVKTGKQFDSPDSLITYIDKFDEYGIIIHDGGTSHSEIKFCPWCGARLPPSRRDEWFDRLEALGYTDPANDSIPEDFNSDRWYREEKD